MLIYLEPRLQETVFATFHYALRSDGFLVVGPAETPGASSALFSALSTRSTGSTPEDDAPAPRLFSSVARRRADAGRGTEPVRKAPRRRSDVPREADRMLLARYGPAGVVVDEGLRILEFRGDTDPFLEHGARARPA